MIRFISTLTIIVVLGILMDISPLKSLRIALSQPVLVPPLSLILHFLFPILFLLLVKLSYIRTLIPAALLAHRRILIAAHVLL